MRVQRQGYTQAEERDDGWDDGRPAGRGEAEHRRTSLALGAGAVLLVLVAWACAGLVSLSAAVLAAAAAASLLANEVMGADGVPETSPVPCHGRDRPAA